MTTQPEDAARMPIWTIQDRLRKAREWAGLDQDELAERMGTSRQTVGSYERERRTPRRVTVMAWAMACGVDPAFLLPHLDSNQEPSGYRTAQVTRLDDYRSHVCATPDRVETSGHFVSILGR